MLRGGDWARAPSGQFEKGGETMKEGRGEEGFTGERILEITPFLW